MTRDEIEELMINSGFTFEKTVLSYPARRGLESIYTRRPKFKYTFRVSKVTEDKNDYGLYIGIGDQFRELDSKVQHDIDVQEVWGGSKQLPMWTGENLKKLLNLLESS